MRRWLRADPPAMNGTPRDWRWRWSTTGERGLGLAARLGFLARREPMDAPFVDRIDAAS